MVVCVDQTRQSLSHFEDVIKFDMLLLILLFPFLTNLSIVEFYVQTVTNVNSLRLLANFSEA